jgi:hypothetical protein
MMTAEQKAAWLAARAGKLTASRMCDAMDYLKPKKQGDPPLPSAKRIKLMHELLAERLTGFSVPHVVTEPMMHGLEYEDEAADEFVTRRGCMSIRSSTTSRPPRTGKLALMGCSRSSVRRRRRTWNGCWRA